MALMINFIIAYHKNNWQKQWEKCNSKAICSSVIGAILRIIFVTSIWTGGFVPVVEDEAGQWWRGRRRAGGGGPVVEGRTNAGR
jgi:hypothetical protein